MVQFITRDRILNTQNRIILVKLPWDQPSLVFLVIQDGVQDGHQRVMRPESLRKQANSRLILFCNTPFQLIW